MVGYRATVLSYPFFYVRGYLSLLFVHYRQLFHGSVHTGFRSASGGVVVDAVRDHCGRRVEPNSLRRLFGVHVDEAKDPSGLLANFRAAFVLVTGACGLGMIEVAFRWIVSPRKDASSTDAGGDGTGFFPDGVQVFGDFYHCFQW